MVERDIILETVVAVVGTAILLAFILYAGSTAGADGTGDATLMVVGIAAFILYMTVGGWWLYRH